MTLGFPTLIMGLCMKTGVYIPNVATKRISSIMNDDYVLRHCVPKLAGEAAPQPQAHAPPVGLMRDQLFLGESIAEIWSYSVGSEDV
ncbi:hypothetical protein RYX36_028963 [Vicia faba]